jgi:hypothetical protein
MAESVSCPYCRKWLEAPDDYQGKELRCPECQKVFVGGAQSSITAEAPRPSAVDERPTDVQAGLPAWPGHREHDDAADLYPLGRASSLHAFRPAGGLATATMALLGVSLLIGVCLLGSNFLQYQLAERVVAGVRVPEHELQSSASLQGILGGVNFVVFVVTAIVFICWFNRAHSNLEPLGARGLAYTSGWAAGCWFVPVLNLFRPIQIAQEIWRHSDPVEIANPPGNSALLGTWWAAWIASNVAGQISLRLNMAVNTPQSLKEATTVSIVTEVIVILAAMFAIAVVRTIDARQTARAEALSSEANSLESKYR